MGIHILSGVIDGERPAAVLICGTSGEVFPGVYRSDTEAEQFIQHVRSVYGTARGFFRREESVRLLEIWRRELDAERLASSRDGSW